MSADESDMRWKFAAASVMESDRELMGVHFAEGECLLAGCEWLITESIQENNQWHLYLQGLLRS